MEWSLLERTPWLCLSAPPYLALLTGRSLVVDDVPVGAGGQLRSVQGRRCVATISRWSLVCPVAAASCVALERSPLGGGGGTASVWWPREAHITVWLVITAGPRSPDRLDLRVVGSPPGGAPDVSSEPALVSPLLRLWEGNWVPEA